MNPFRRVLRGAQFVRAYIPWLLILRKIAAGEHDQLGDISTLADPMVVDNLVEQRMNR